MEDLAPLVAILRNWLPFLITLLIAIVVLATAHRMLIKRQPPTSGSMVSRQLLVTAVAGVFLVVLILELPIDNEPRGQLMALLGILVTAAVALSSTTLLGNMMAGVMLRSIRHFRAGDFIIVEGHRGRVSEFGLLRTEIQTERRNLTTLPNMYLATNPVTVVRTSGTFIAATVSLGYDVPREKIEKCLIDAAEHAGLTDPFVFVLELGDFSITYQAAGFLEEVKYLISAESELRECMLDSLHRAGIEIVSPTFMNQRQLPLDREFIPKVQQVARPKPPAADESKPEERMFDKAEIAEGEAKAEETLKEVLEQIEALGKERDGKADAEAYEARLRELKAQRAELEAEVARHKELKKKERAEDEES